MLIYMIINITDSEVWLVTTNEQKARKQLAITIKENSWGEFRIQKSKVE